nr:GNAT family N-acetyltransferase [Nakamurella flavida]
MQPDPGRLVLVAERAGRVIGVAHSGPPHHPEADPAITRELHQLHVDPTVARSGAGSLLMAETLSTWAAAGHRAGRLWVWGFNAPALAFYTAFGWRPDGAVRPDTPPIDGHAMIGLRRDDLTEGSPPPA